MPTKTKPDAQPPAVGFLKSFGRSQVTSVLATAVDFGLLFSLTEFLGVWYVISTALGALAGAVTNFILNRVWSFEATAGFWGGQAFRYALVSGGSLLLNTFGAYALTEWAGLRYGYSVLLTSLFVGFAFNYPLQRFYVFRRGKSSGALA